MAHFIYPQATSTTAFSLDGSTVAPTYDSGNALLNKGMPIVALAGEGLGPLDVASGVSGATTLRVVLSSDSTISIEEDHNYGVVGATTLRTAAQIGNATGAAAFGSGADSAQTLRVTLSTRAETATTPLSVRLTDGAAFLTNLPVSQSGTWNLNNISGTISLPTGAATESTLSGMSAKLPAALGQTNMAGSLSVAIASNQSALTVAQATAANLNATVVGTGTFAVQATQAGTWNLNNISGTISLPTGAATESTLSALNTKVAADFGASSGSIRTASLVGNATGAAAFGTGASSAQTLRVVLADESKPQVGLSPVAVITRTYSSSNVTGTYTNLGTALPAAAYMLTFFETGGVPLIVGWGSVDKFIIPPGGAESPLPVSIPNGTQLQIKTADGSTVSSGNLYITVLGA